MLVVDMGAHFTTAIPFDSTTPYYVDDLLSSECNRPMVKVSLVVDSSSRLLRT